MSDNTNKCQNCENRNCFGYAPLLIPGKLITDKSINLSDSCGLLTGRQFVAHLMGNYQELKTPITIVQKKHHGCSFSDAPYQRFEWERKHDSHVDPYKPVCKIIHKNKESSYCERCNKFDERVLEIILNANFSYNSEERFNELKHRCEKDDAKHEEKLNITVKTTKETPNDERPDIKHRIYLEYKCPITGFTEIAIPFIFNKENKLVLFFGQHFIKNDEQEIKEKLDNFFSNAGRNKIDTSDKEYNEARKNHFELFRKGYNINTIPYAIGEEELRNRIIALFDYVRDVKKLLDDLLIAKVHKQMDDTLNKAYKIFKNQYDANHIEEGYYYTDATNRLNNLRQAVENAMKMFSKNLNVDLTLFLSDTIRIQENDKITLKPLHALDEQTKVNGIIKENITIYNNKITKCDSRLNLRKKDMVMFRVYPYPGEEKKDIKLIDIKADFPVAFFVDFKNAPEPWFKWEGKLHEEIRETFSRILSAFAQHIRAEGTEIQAAFNAVRIEHFSSVLRHEIGQKTGMMKNRHDQYQQFLNDHYRNNNADIRSADWSWDRDKNQLNNFRRTLKTFIFDTMAHVYSVSVMSDSGRYLKGIPTPNKQYFEPYKKILFKWRNMFKSSCKDAYLHCPFPGVEKIFDSDKRWIDYPEMYADVDQIEQVAYNLTINAIKYSHRYTSFELDCRRTSNVDGTWYEFSVTNYSSPIEKTQQKEIFKFGKLGNNQQNAKNVKEGSGLGLYISRNIAVAHGGALTVDESSSEALFEYNIPFLLLSDKLPEEWRPGGSMATRVGKGKDGAEKLKMARNSIRERKDLLKIVHPEILKLIENRDQLNLDIFIKEWAKSQEKNETLEVSKGKWLHTFYDELCKPTARITFTMKIPAN